MSLLVDLSYEASYKVVIVGDSAVGKSTYMVKIDEKPEEEKSEEEKSEEEKLEEEKSEEEKSKNKKLMIYSPTYGVDAKIKHFKYTRSNGHSSICRLVIWDTAGQEKFRSISTSFLRGSHVVLLCFALDDPLSFSDIEKEWLPLIKTWAPNSKIILLGLKSDRPSKIEYEEIKELCDRNTIEIFVPVSSLNCRNVWESMELVLGCMRTFYRRDFPSTKREDVSEESLLESTITWCDPKPNIVRINPPPRPEEKSGCC